MADVPVPHAEGSGCGRGAEQMGDGLRRLRPAEAHGVHPFVVPPLACGERAVVDADRREPRRTPIEADLGVFRVREGRGVQPVVLDAAHEEGVVDAHVGSGEVLPEDGGVGPVLQHERRRVEGRFRVAHVVRLARDRVDEDGDDVPAVAAVADHAVHADADDVHASEESRRELERGVGAHDRLHGLVGRGGQRERHGHTLAPGEVSAGVRERQVGAGEVVGAGKVLPGGGLRIVQAAPRVVDSVPVGDEAVGDVRGGVVTVDQHEARLMRGGVVAGGQGHVGGGGVRGDRAAGGDVVPAVRAPAGVRRAPHEVDVARIRHRVEDEVRARAIDRHREVHAPGRNREGRACRDRHYKGQFLHLSMPPLNDSSLTGRYDTINTPFAKVRVEGGAHFASFA